MVEAQAIDEDRRVFHVLDLIRGIAAIAVMQRHVAFKIDPHVHGTFLAVDLFFVLSGFVIAHAYEARLRRGLPIGRFMAMRLIRLWPLYAIGLALGFVELALVSPLVRSAVPTGDLVVAVLLGATMMLPLGFPALDTPRWSLFYELVANAGHAVLLKRISIGGILAIALCSATCILIALARGAQLDSGWLPRDFGIGLGRVGYSYCAGILLYRARSALMSPPSLILWGLWVGALAAIGALVLPHATAAEFAVVVIAFPILVHFAAKVDVRGVAERVCVFLGTASYAIYILHEPIANLVQDGLTANGLRVGDGRLWGFAFLAAIMALSWSIDRFYDRPLRKWLSRTFVR